MESARKDSLRWWILITVIIGTFLGRLDQTIVNLALPKIIDDFGITVTAAGWIGTAYILANAVFVPIWGKLGDTIGRKKVYIIGFSIFIFGSLLAGIAWNLSSMILFRIIQAIAGSADYPTAMAIIAVTFKEGKERAQALGLWSTSFAAAAVFGPLIGGPLIDSFGWRSIFLINIPVGIVGIVMAFFFITESTSEKKTVHFDWLGAFALGIALSAFVLVLDKGLDWGWLSGWSILMYALTVLFALIFYRIERSHPEPIVDFKFFKNTTFNGTIINNFLVFMGLMGGVFLIPLFVQTFLGFNATETGYIFIPMAACMVISASLGARLTGKVQSRYVIAISTGVAALGLFLFTFLDPRSGAIDVIIPLSVMASGLGFAMSQRTNAIAAVVPEHEIGIASSVLALARNIAGAFGIAVFSTLLTKSIESNVLTIASNSAVHSTSQLVFSQAAGLIILKAEISGYQTVFLVASIVLLTGAVLALFLKIQDSKTKVEVIAEG
jgi:EmrB/QacA subfamily drug resistance transporter